MNAQVKAAVDSRGITRLCHFTPSRNLLHILSGKNGILPTAKLSAEERAVFTPTDLARLDGFPSHICCSVEYPNAWFFNQARTKEELFKDWVVVLVAPHYLWADGTKFCQRNAASGYGRFVMTGITGFESMYSRSVLGAGGKTRMRMPRQLSCCPTDDQAEVLVPASIGLKDIQGVVVISEEQARREDTRLKYVGVETHPKWIICPDYFDPYKLSVRIRTGVRPREDVWHPRP